MKKLDRYILKQFIGPFITILSVVVFVLLMQFLWVYIDELVGKGLSVGVILEFMMWGACTILPLALPLATLLSAVMTLGQMGEHSELTAIKASGISVMRVFAPLAAASVIISIGAYFASNNLVPKAYNEIFTLRDDISRTKDEIKIPAGIFYDGIEGYVLRVDETDDSGMMRGVMVYDHTARKGNVMITLADSAILKMSKAKDYLIFTLYNGSNYQETNTWNYRDTSMQMQRMEFDRQELVISLTNYAFEKSDSSRFGDQAKSMRMDQLLRQQDSLKTSLEQAHDKTYEQFVKVSSNLTFRSQLDTSVKRPSTVFFSEGFLEWDNIRDEIRACETALERCSAMQGEVSVMGQATYESLFYLRRTDIEIFKKIAQALACLLLFFVGAPLGALIRRGGLGTSLLVSLLFFVLYWVVDISGTKLARDGAIASVIGVFVSSAVMLPLGVFLCSKAAHDSDIFSMETLKTLWRRVTSRLGAIFHKTRIVYMGTPEFSVAPLDALLGRGYKVVGVVTVADKPSGRGLAVNESAVKKYARSRNIPVLQPLKLKDPEFLRELKALKADLFVVVAFRMLPEEVWTMPRLGTFNLHAALLPQYRGAAPINWAVINGERMTGVTTFMIDRNMDTGGILLREECRISDTDTAGDIHDRLMEIGSSLVVTTVEGIIQRNIETRVQRSFIQGSEVLRPAPKLSRELCHIDWDDTADSVYNLIRGLSPYPAAYTELVRDGVSTQLKIYSASRMEAHAAPGTVLSDGRTYLAIATRDGAVSLDEVQLAGKKRMDIRTFLLGFRDPGACTVSQGTSRSEKARLGV